MKLFWTLSVLALCLVPRRTSGETFAECVSCTSLLPDAVTCIFESTECQIFDCEVDDAGVLNVTSCPACAACVNDVMECFDDCLPACLDTVVDDFVSCLAETDQCFFDCSPYQGISNGVSMPPFTTPEDCDLGSLLTDPISCLPVFPACDDVQDTAIDATCEATECCSECWSEKSAIESCFYNWLSGSDCTFNCDSVTPSSTNTTAEARTTRQSAQEKPSFIDDCKEKLSADLVFQQGAAFNDYIECLMSNSMNFVSDEANRPPATDAPTTTTSGGAKSVTMVVLPVAMAAFLFAFV